MANCTHSATQMEDLDRACPLGVEPAFVDNDDDTDAWFGAGHASENGAHDPILEAMKAIGVATAKVPPVTASVPAPTALAEDTLMQAVPALFAEPPLQPPAPQSPPPGGAAVRRRVIYGVVAVPIFVTLAAVLINIRGVSLPQFTDLATDAKAVLSTLSPPRESAPRDAAPAPPSAPPTAPRVREAVPVAIPAPAVEVPPKLADPDRSGEAPAGAVAAALGLSERAAVPRQATPPPTAPEVAPPATSVVTGPGNQGAKAPAPCSEALAALALCTRP